MKSEFIRNTFGTVDRYDRGKGFGWLKLYCDKWNDAFVSWRDVEPEKEGLKKLFPKQFVKFGLHSNDKGFAAKNVIVISETEYNNLVEEFEDKKFNK